MIGRLRWYWSLLTLVMVLTAVILLVYRPQDTRPPFLRFRAINDSFSSRLVETASDGPRARLREYLSSVDELERLRMMLLNSKNGSPPNLTQENCTRLMTSEDKKRATNRTVFTRPPERNLSEILTLTENCTRYMLSTGFRFAKISQEELSFPLAFSLLVYRDLEQVERLLRAVYRPHNVYCVHADRKSDVNFQSGLRLIVGCLPNVFMVDKSVSVRWGAFTVLEPELICMRRLLEHRAKWFYFINLTGQEFPLKTNRELVQILKELRGANDIGGTHHPMFTFRWKNSKPAPYNLTMSKGDVHLVASRGYVDYVVNSGVAHKLYEWLKYSFIPDESFFSTLNHSPKLGVPGSYIGDLEKEKPSLRSYKLWDYQRKKCSGKWVRMICHFGEGDLPRLIASPNLVANKFSYNFQPLVYDCLEKWYFDKVTKENLGLPKPFNHTLYTNSDIVKLRYMGPILIWD